MESTVPGQNARWTCIIMVPLFTQICIEMQCISFNTDSEIVEDSEVIAFYCGNLKTEKPSSLNNVVV